MKFRIAQALMLGVCLSLFSSVANADSGEAKPAAVQVRSESGIAGNPGAKAMGGIMTISEAPENSASQVVEPAPPISGDILKKQEEIDRYLFEQHKDEISAMGLTITHTAPYEKYVEIGIVPFNEQNEEYLYKTFGKENIKVVKGTRAVLLDSSAVPDEASVTSVKAANIGAGATSEASKGEAADSGIMVPVMVQAGPTAVDGRGAGTVPAENERGQIYTIAGGAEPASAPEIAATAAPAKSEGTMTAIFVIAAIVLMAGGTILLRRRNAVKS